MWGRRWHARGVGRAEIAPGEQGERSWKLGEYMAVDSSIFKAEALDRGICLITTEKEKARRRKLIMNFAQAETTKERKYRLPGYKGKTRRTLLAILSQNYHRRENPLECQAQELTPACRKGPCPAWKGFGLVATSRTKTISPAALYRQFVNLPGQNCTNSVGWCSPSKFKRAVAALRPERDYIQEEGRKDTEGAETRGKQVAWE